MLYGIIINNTTTDAKSVVMFLTLHEAEIFSDKFQSYINNGDTDFIDYMNKYGLAFSSKQSDIRIDGRRGYSIVTIDAATRYHLDIIDTYEGRFRFKLV